MAYPGGGSPVRPSIERLGTSVSTGGHGVLLNDDSSIDEGETVESLMSKLAIERRVQYGAEKMLDVMEQRTGDSQEQIKERITAQLEVSNDKIKLLESKLEKLRGAQQPRAPRGPKRLNGTAPLSTSASSSMLLGPGRPSRPGTALARAPLTPERSAPPDFFSSGTPSKRSQAPSSALASSAEEGYFAYKPSGDEDASTAIQQDAYRATARQLRALAHAATEGKGKTAERGDEPWDAMTRLTDLFKQSPALRRHVEIEDVLQSVLLFLADDSTSRRRAAAYRLLRYMLTRLNWGRMINGGLQWIIIRTFTRDAKAVHEREQALRLLRTVVVLPELSPREIGILHRASVASVIEDPIAVLLRHRVPLQQGLVRAIVSAAENQDDAMRIICMETLVEIALLDLECLLRADAFRIVLNALKDGPWELGLGITGSLLYLVNLPATREMLIPGSDVEVGCVIPKKLTRQTVLVGLTENYGKVSLRHMQRHLDELDHCVRNVGMLLGTWSGMLYLCMDNYRAVKSLISSLHVPMSEMRNALLDLFFSAFRIKAPSWTSAFLDGRRLTVYNRTFDASNQLQETLDEDEPPQPLNLCDHYVAFLLAVFIESGLIEVRWPIAQVLTSQALVALVQDEECEQSVRRKATLLLGELLQLANRVLPLQYAAQIQSLPRLFSGVTEFSKPDERNAALSALSSIDSLFRNNRKRVHGEVVRQSRLAPSSVQESLKRSQRQVQQVKLRLGLQMDDKAFQLMINESGVLLSRDHTKWNYDVIMDLLQGPLLNPKRLDEVMKATKFIRRLFSFLHPFNNRFSSILRTRPNHKWVRLACALLTTLMVNPEGQRALSEDKLLRQMVDCLTELDQYAGQPSAQPVFARDRLENTLSYGYFEMIGTLSKHTAGIKLLEKFKFFTCFHHLCELRSREDIIKLIIECFDYTIDAHQRIVLSKALTSSYMETRLFATHHLGRLLNESPDLTDWAIQLLITQLYDPALDVCEIAVMYLEGACTDPVNLEKVVHLSPTLDHLGDIAANLYLRFMSTSVGFRYLQHANYVDYELENWLADQNLLYVIEVETFVSKTIRPFARDSVDDYWEYEGTAPTHFFGELCKTPEGCQYLREKGLVPAFAEIVRQHGMEASDQALMTSVKSALWVLGNIGSTEGGLAFLEDEEIIDVIIEIAEKSPVLTLKGTSFFVIGLISSTQMGAEILEEYGWVATRTPMGQTTGLCLPNDLTRFAHIEPWKPRRVDPTTPPLPVLTGLEGEVMGMISKLSNYVLAAGAMNNLKRVRNRHPRLFHSVTFFHRAMRAISTNHFQAPVRKFILDLFDVEIGPHTLPRLAHVERGSYIQGPPHPDVIPTEVLPGATPMVDSPGVVDNISPTDADSRPRASSSPGREPPSRERRTRSITISDIAGSSSNTPTPKATAESRVEPQAAPPHEEGSNRVNGEQVHHEPEETHAL
ncbi:Target of rapamycin complex 2 subunit ste20 [Vanrija pseudolonga]|uniref:Target of rapamycin complex 2 subunit ste20 n=1 Tax=Vanrija pseudolonga TaxID=143232 RepID=A0AAF0Y8L0_9TREE|nr:Target of rapamycin complex 2 subunit ste20 [Vanrija pseudolonga]